MRFCKKLIALVLITKTKKESTTYTLNTKKETEKTAIANKTIYTNLVRLLQPPVR